MCFDLFHKLDSDIQCNENHNKISNIFSIQQLKELLFEVFSLEGSYKNLEAIAAEVKKYHGCPITLKQELEDFTSNFVHQPALTVAI